ncbi:MAG TPA: right-handed parallel beta-helix repeat-containing protein, partial [Thermoguttaceae bacterium]|nr:right-handed parallel beta-helix repeat-containing protein [Thermoguttaceae bacterium]
MNISSRWLCLLLTFILALSVGDVFAAEYVVAPTGDDAAAGNREAPFRTIGQAAIRMQPGDTCLIRGGDYFETVEPSADGTADAPIVFKAWPGETPTVWGTEPITDWKHQADGTYRAPMDWSLGKNNQIFIDGKVADEARWPNTQDDDLLTPEGAHITRGGDDFIQCDQLPDGLADDHFKGAVLWALAGAKWTSWSTTVDSYDAGTKTLHFATSSKGVIPQQMSPADRRGGYFTLVGKREMLDAPGEWYYDEAEKMLYLRVADGADPGSLHVTAKRRMTVVKLDGRSHIQVSGLDIVGATIDAQESAHCRVRDVRVRYLSHTHGGRSSYSLNEPTGIRISGHNNVIRDSEVAFSAGSGVYLSGQSNAVINCWIHDIDYMGSYGCPVKTSGTGHLISHNTIHDAGRDCMQPGGQAHLIQYNDIYRMGRICHDLGATYVCGSDGGGTEFRYNYSHENVAEGVRMGIYLDNFTSNYLVHHNVCWDTRGDEIRLNKPSLYNIVAHNTMLGYSGNWGRWPTDWMYGCIYANNLLSADIRPHPQQTLVGNLQNVSEDALDASNFQTTTAGVDRGVVVPGISGPFQGTAPDVGAYEQGLPAWRAGH